MKVSIKSVPLEAIIWIVGLLTLMIMDPTNEHISICPFKNAGFDFCPGCGLGQSISLLVRGEFSKSFHAHPLGFIAIIVITARIVQLIRKTRRPYGKAH